MLVHIRTVFGAITRRRLQLNLLSRLARLVQDNPVSLLVDAKRLTFHLPRQIEQLLWDAVACQLVGIFGHALLERFENLRCRMEEAVGRHQAVNTLMGTLQIIIVNPQPDPLAGIRQIQKDGGLQTFPPQAAPKPFDLS